MAVVHCKRASFDVYIGRPSKWGNPFTIGKDGNREQVIAKFADWVKTQPALMADLHSLLGKTLGCWCSPQPCHGDVLERLAREQVVEELGLHENWEEWPGRTEVYGIVVRDNCVERASMLGVEPEEFGLYAEDQNGFTMWVKDFSTGAEAMAAEARLGLLMSGKKLGVEGEAAVDPTDSTIGARQ